MDLNHIRKKKKLPNLEQIQKSIGSTKERNRHYSGHCRTIDIEGDHRTRGEETGERNVDCRFQVKVDL